MTWRHECSRPFWDTDTLLEMMPEERRLYRRINMGSAATTILALAEQQKHFLCIVHLTADCCDRITVLRHEPTANISFFLRAHSYVSMFVSAACELLKNEEWIYGHRGSCPRPYLLGVILITKYFIYSTSSLIILSICQIRGNETAHMI
jgi:hypothetical protein